MHSYIPGYIRARQTGRLQQAVQLALDMLPSCTLCPRQCRVNRTGKEAGYCGTGRQATVASYSPHFGEEPPLVGDHGSGTIFFSHCNLQCVFCQNHDISIQGDGHIIFPDQLAAMMIRLQAQGCHNINLVTPTHVVPQILEALDTAVDLGLRIPLVYNCSGYESLDTLALLDGIIDIYMPDFKFSDPASARLCTSKPDYPDVAKAAIREMYGQVGDLTLDERGVARRGLLVRHLVLPGGHAGTAEVMRFLAEEISANTCVNVMDQYFPAHEAHLHPPFDRRVSREEYLAARKMAEDAGLRLVESL